MFLFAACSGKEPPDLRDPAEQLARQWYAAIAARDSEKLAAISHDPFYFDDPTPVTGAEIARIYRLPGLLDGVRKPSSQQMTTSTVEAARRASRDARFAEIEKSLSIRPDDYFVETDASALFIRFVGGQPRVLAYWD